MNIITVNYKCSGHYPQFTRQTNDTLFGRPFIIDH